MRMKKLMSIATSLLGAGLATVPIVLAATVPLPLTYGVNVNGFTNNRFPTHHTRPNASPLKGYKNPHSDPKPDVLATPLPVGGQTDSRVDVDPPGKGGVSLVSQTTADRAGNLYTISSDNRQIWLRISLDRGRTWSSAYQVNQTGPVPKASDPYTTKGAWLANPNSRSGAYGRAQAYSVNPTPDAYNQQQWIPAYSNVSMRPRVVAGAPGKLDIVWYGTNMTNGADGKTAFDTADDHVHWSVFLAQTTNALSKHPTFVEHPISPVVHRAGVEALGTRVANGEDNQDLCGEFGISLSSHGLATVAYTSDQLEPTDSTYYCQENNSRHDAFAVQTSTAIFGPIA